MAISFWSAPCRNLYGTTIHLRAVFPPFIYIGTHFKQPEFVAISMFAQQVLSYFLHTGGYWVA
jgi:hypothetical protein